MGHWLRFLPSGRRVRVAPGTTLLEGARRAGLPVARACGAAGLCGRCGLEIVAGAEHLPPETPDESRTKRRNRIPPKLRLSCRVAPAGDVTVTAAYW
jgi:ferredoxin